MKICMIGTGYVGLVSGTCFADLGNTVYCVDNNKKKIDSLNNGETIIYEPGLEELINRNYKNKRLKFTTNLRIAVEQSDIIFICVGTPTLKNKSADLKYVYQVTRQIRNYIKKFKIIVTKSTVPVSTGDQIEKIINQKVSKRNFEVISNPEFLREGEAIRDFRFPDRIVVGTNNNKVIKKMGALYEPLTKKGAILFLTSRRGAELIKYASNAFLATKITFINEISNLCEKIGVDIEDISIGMGLDKRIGSRFLRAGPAYGGSCFPKDTRAIIRSGDYFKSNLSIVKSVVKSNDDRKKLLIKKIEKIMSNKFKNKKIAFLGVTFKPNTDDMRESSSLQIIPNLSKKNAKVYYYDPSGMKKVFSRYKNVFFSENIEDSCFKADLLIINTEWDEFKSLDFKKLVKKRKINVFDMRNLYSVKKMKVLGINYYSIGR